MLLIRKKKKFERTVISEKKLVSVNILGESASIYSAEAAKCFFADFRDADISPGEAFDDDVLAVGYAPTEQLYVPIRSYDDLKTFYIHYRGVCEVFGKDGFLYVDGKVNEELCSPRLQFTFEELRHNAQVCFCRGYRPKPLKDVYDFQGVYIHEDDFENDIAWQ